MIGTKIGTYFIRCRASQIQMRIARERLVKRSRFDFDDLSSS
jgi:hypothetical protein